MSLFNMKSKNEIELSSAAAASCYASGDYAGVCRVLGHYKMMVDLRDQGIVPHLMLDGYWESWVTHVVAQMVRPGWTVANVGANFGYYALLFADLVGSNGQVHAFEPDRYIFHMLGISRAMNGFLHLTPHPIALSNRCAPRTLARPFGYWNGRLLPEGETGSDMATEQRVMTSTLDTLIVANDSKLDLVLIDAEGSELEIWEGMERLRKKNPDLITVMEFAPSRYADPLAFAQSLAGDGKRLGVITDKGEIAPRTPGQVALGENPGMPTGWGEEFMVVVQP